MSRQSRSKIPLRGRSMSATRLSVATPSCSASSSRSRSVQRNVTQQSLRPSTSSNRMKSPNHLLEKRPINDSAWINKEHKRIKQYFLDLDPSNPVVLKPLSMQMFIYITNILFGGVDEAVKITAENYKEELVSLLEFLDYPATSGQLKILFKCPNIPHSFPKIVSMWSFLLDIIEKSVDENHPTSVIDYYLECYTRAVNQTDSIQCSDDTLTEDYIRELLHKEGIDKAAFAEERRNAEKDLKYYSKQFEEACAKNTEYSAQFKESQETVKKLEEKVSRSKAAVKNFNDDFEVQLKTVNDKIESTHEENKKVKQKLKDIEAKLSVETHSLSDVKKLQRETEESKFTAKLLDERINLLMGMIEEKDLHLADQRRTLQSLIFSINNKIIQKKLVYPEIEKVRLHETGFAQPDYLKDVERKMLLYKKIEEKTQEECDRMSNEIEQVEKNLEGINAKIKAAREGRDGLLKIQADVEEKAMIERAEQKTVFDAKKEQLSKEIKVLSQLNEEVKDFDSSDLLETTQKEVSDLENEDKATLVRVDQFLKKQKDFALKVKIDKMRMIQADIEEKEKERDERKMVLLEQQELLAVLLLNIKN